MKMRKDKLDRLRVASPCDSSWGAMEGDARRRHCAQCDRPVYDFSRLTPREIAGVLEANRGSLCARLTRDGAGRLVTLPALAVSAADPQLSRRLPSLGAALVTAVLGLAAAGCADQLLAESPAAVEPVVPEGAQAARGAHGGDTGGTLRGRLATESGEAIAGAQVTIANQLDGQQQVGVTDVDGRFAFAGVPAGIYGVSAAVRGQSAAEEGGVLLATGDRREVGLTVPTDTWQRIAAGGTAGEALGGVIAMVQTPLATAFTNAPLAVLGVVGKTVVVDKDEYTRHVRTDVTVTAVVKGETRERVVSIFHDETADDALSGHLFPGSALLAFLEPHAAEDGRGSDGYAGTDEFALRALGAEEVEPYRQRLEALARITRDGRQQPGDRVEWLVATAEDPLTRGEAVADLGDAVSYLARQAEAHGVPADQYAARLRQVFADFTAGGGQAESYLDPAVSGAFLTADQRERLSAALLRTEHLTGTDLQLYGVVKGWHEDRLLPWLEKRLRAADPQQDDTLEIMDTLATELYQPNDRRLNDILEEGRARLDELSEKLGRASGASQMRVLALRRGAEEKLKQDFLTALEQQSRQ